MELNDACHNEQNTVLLNTFSMEIGRRFLFYLSLILTCLLNK